MRDFVEYLLTQIVTKPEEVEVTEDSQDGNVDIKIKVAPEDMGLVIGKEGKNIRSLRALAKAKAIRENVRVNIQLLESKEEQTE